ncbi:glycoside hydrolase family protein [Erythrobacter aquimaris]|uniref:Lysozyme n=1 Tax=Qipengyuania aquimaris TaxID=255984 RepID=A0A6I4TJQ8_9SPHN|nr:lysozyme [Qipengyuania aquimaris]MXO96272.1 glycoside hydrolase family protein [Qipengyuania aquimaris]
MNRKYIFDHVRRMLGRGFRQAEVDALDRVLDDASGYSSQGRVPSVPLCRIGEAGIQLIKRFEGCARLRRDGLVEAYPDPGTGGPPWTIGWGSTGAEIGPQTVWSQEQCDARLEADLKLYASEVAAAIGDAPTTQGQFDALVSFHYNTGAIHRATLARLHRQGRYEEAALEFGRWKHAGGRVMKGLVRRRAEEARLYRT